MKYVSDCIETNWVSSVGSYVDKFEQMSAAYCDVAKGIAATNGTAALHISLILGGVQRGDLVILPNITFVAPANVIKYIGADPLLMDVDKDTWQLDTVLLERFLATECEVRGGYCYHVSSGRRIPVILPVHVLGNMVNMEALMTLAESYRLTVIEDATEALGSTYNGKPAGSFGLFGCLSYNGNKIITTGGGGMILTNDEKLAAKAKHLTTQAKASALDYYHDELGYNYRLVNILAAIGVAQMEQLDAFIVRKRAVAEMYSSALKEVPGFRPQTVTANVNPNCWLYTAAFHRSKELIAYLKEHQVQARPFWVPMNQLPVFENDVYYNNGDISGEVFGDCVSLPCSSGITDEMVAIVINKIKEFYA